MPDALPRTRWQSLSTTPLRDLLRGRVTARLDWRSRLTAAGLPAEVSSLIGRVVRRTSLWRLEKAAVADELIAHFADGVAAGTSAGQLVRDFGDERVAAKLIRRAKRRNRPLLWRASAWVWRGSTIVAVFYCALLTRFVIGRPQPSVDYIAKLAAPARAVPESDRAWPLWRSVVLACTTPDGFGGRTWPDLIESDIDQHPAPAAVSAWLTAHAEALATARAAAARPSMGFILGAGGSADDSAMFGTVHETDEDGVVNILLPDLNCTRGLAELLVADSAAAATAGQGNRVVSDIVAAHRLARQLRGSGVVLTDLVALGIDALAVEQSNRLLAGHPALLSDAMLTRLAHTFAGPEVASDLIDVRQERTAFDDMVQRIYTDDGHGDGRVTLAGLKKLSFCSVVFGEASRFGSSSSSSLTDLASFALIPVAIASRSTITAHYDEMMSRAESNFARPRSDADWSSYINQIRTWRKSAIDSIRYVPLLTMILTGGQSQESAERYLGSRDGLLVGIALELYHRRSGHDPATLAELTPQLLPAIPADRITGNPLHYRLIAGKPVVYSVGADRTDDGGTPAVGRDHKPDATLAAVWDVQASAVPHGDWLLYPPIDAN